MPYATITVHPNGAETLRLTGAFESVETEEGWRVEMLAEASLLDVTPEQVVSEAADLAVGDTHYSGQVAEYNPADGRIIVEGRGPAPA